MCASSTLQPVFPANDGGSQVVPSQAELNDMPVYHGASTLASSGYYSGASAHSFHRQVGSFGPSMGYVQGHTMYVAISCQF